MTDDSIRLEIDLEKTGLIATDVLGPIIVTGCTGQTRPLRSCGGDRCRDSTRHQHRCDEVQFRSRGSTAVAAGYRIASGPTVSRSTRAARRRSRGVAARFDHLGSAPGINAFRVSMRWAWSWSEVVTMRFMDARLHFRHSAACSVASKTCCRPSMGGGYRPAPTRDAPDPAPPRSPGP